MLLLRCHSVEHESLRHSCTSQSLVLLKRSDQPRRFLLGALTDPNSSFIIHVKLLASRLSSLFQSAGACQDDKRKLLVFLRQETSPLSWSGAELHIAHQSMSIHDRCNLRAEERTSGSVLCVMFYQFVCLWWGSDGSSEWIRDGQRAGSVLYLLLYLFFCAQHLKSCTELYWGQEAVNKVGLKCNVFYFSSHTTTKLSSSFCYCLSNKQIIWCECFSIPER